MEHLGCWSDEKDSRVLEVFLGENKTLSQCQQLASSYKYFGKRVSSFLNCSLILLKKLMFQNWRCYASNNDNYDRYGSSDECVDFQGSSGKECEESNSNGIGNGIGNLLGSGNTCDGTETFAVSIYQHLSNPPNANMFFPFANGMKTWGEARNFCQQRGGPESSFAFDDYAADSQGNENITK